MAKVRLVGTVNTASGLGDEYIPYRTNTGFSDSWLLYSGGVLTSISLGTYQGLQMDPVNEMYSVGELINNITVDAHNNKLIFNGAGITSAVPGVHSSFLNIKVNGTSYKIDLGV